MLVAGFPAGPWGTNCYVVATGPGARSAWSSTPARTPRAASRRWSASTASSRSRSCSPTGTSTTCGRVAPVVRRARRPGLHPPRRPAPADRPGPGALARDGRRCWLGGGYELRRARRRPRARRRRRPSSSPASSFVVDHTPGHTRGSVTFRTPYGDQATIRRCCSPATCSSRGSIGRTDLPGGDHDQMLASLAREGACRCPTRPSCCPATARETTIGRERATNPFLQELDAVDSAPVSREGSDVTDSFRAPKGVPEYLAAATSSRVPRGPRGPRGAAAVAAGYGYVETAGVRGHRAVRARRRRVHRRRSARRCTPSPTAAAGRSRCAPRAPPA